MSVKSSAPQSKKCLPVVRKPGTSHFISPGQSLEYGGLGFLLQLSPVFLLYQTEFDSLRDLSEVPLLPMIINVLFYGSCSLVWRSQVLSSADQLLGRTQPRQRPTRSNSWDADSLNTPEVAAL